MAFVSAARIRLSVLQLLSLIAAGGLLLASVNGCTAALAPDDNQPAAPEESDPPVPPASPGKTPEPDVDSLRVGVTADAWTVAEGEAATFTVTAASAPISDPIVVDYTVSGTASADSDYLLPSSTTTLSRGASQAKITIPTLTDNETESQETISVALERASTPFGTVDVDTTPATVTIAEPGAAIVSVAPASALAQEGEPSAFVVTVSGAVRSSVTVSWKTADGTAVAGTDYTAVTGGTLAFGSTRRQTIRVATLQDELNEDDETFGVILTAVSPSAGASLGRATATGTITDDDELPELTIIGGDALEDAGSLAFRVRLAPASGRLVTVSYRTEDDTATAGPDSDYTETGGTLRFTPGGPLERSIRVAIADDSDDEADEGFTVRLHSPVNATLGDAEATGTITDNDDSRQPIIGGPPRLDIADSRANEGEVIMLFTVTLSRPSTEVVSVFYETNDGTAETHPASDYTKTEGALTFSPGGTLQQTIAVPILQDDLDEGSRETFTVKLDAPVNAVLGRHTATGVIVDDDDAPADDHGNTRDSASDITPGTPISGRLETAADVDYFKVTASATRLMVVATDAGRVGETGYDAGTDVRIETSSVTSTNTDDFDAEEVSAGMAYVRVSGAAATRYDLAVWLLEPNESDTSFDIELRYLGTPPTTAQKNAFRAAADVWESIVTGDLARRFIYDSRLACEEDDPSTFGDTVDDLRIDIRLKYNDGPRGTLASAGSCVRRSGGLPLIGDVSFDTADLGGIGSEGLRRVAVHEMAHVLGYGTSFQWDDLLVNSAVIYRRDNPEATTLPDTHFTGSAAVSAFDEAGGDSYTGGQKVPVENNTAEYGAGGLDGHWREAVFGNELLTATISVDSRISQPLSKVTIASLADLGYSVDYTQADSYSLPSTQSLLRTQSTRDDLHLGDHIRRGPVIVAEIPE